MTSKYFKLSRSKDVVRLFWTAGHRLSMVVVYDLDFFQKKGFVDYCFHELLAFVNHQLLMRSASFGYC